MNDILREDAIQIISENDGLKKLFNSKIMITGATGMIGSTIVNTLLILNKEFGANTNMYLISRDINKFSEYVLKNENVHVIEQDIIDPIKCNEKVDYVIHAASPASPLIMREHPVETNFANTLGTANSLIYANKCKSKGFLFVSSREIYGQPEDNQEYFYENGKYGQVDPLIPRNGYAEGKKAAENMCVSFREEYGLNTKIVRLAHTYGPGMSIYDGRVQADFLKNVVNKEDIVLKSTGESIRTYTYVSDAVSAMFKVLLNSNDIVYNVADEKSKTSIKELADTLINIYPERNLKLKFDIKNNVNNGCASFTLGILSTDKIKDELNWRPKYSIHDGFKRTIEYIESEIKNNDKKLIKKI